MNTTDHSDDLVHETVVVGAGLAGLTAARTLTAAGRSVLVVDKGRSVGGRLATRRIGDARLDHGAQFFTVRGDDFAATVGEAEQAGAVHIWNHGFGREADGYPRWCGTTGMNGLAKFLAADLDIRVNVRLESISHAGDEWRLEIAEPTGGTDGGASPRPLRARNVILTAPVPQTMALLDAGGVTLPPAIDDALRAIRYHPVLGLLATFSDGTGLPGPGGMQLPNDEVTESIFSFVGDNRSKGISEPLAVTFHANHAFSAEHFDDDETAVHATLLAAAQEWFSDRLGNAVLAESQLKKWRYAGPVTPHPERVLRHDADGAVALFAGDAFGGPKVEGAFNSGQAAAAALL